MSERVLLQGNEACVEGAIAAGMRFFAGYPITPSTEIAEGCAMRLPQVGGMFIQMEDELASIAAVMGASCVGIKSMTATSGPGFSLMQENIGYGALAEIPCVIVDVQRQGPSTGLPTSPSQGDLMQARWGTHGDHPVIALSPASVREVFDLTVRAFNLSEKYRTPVILLMDEIVAHLREGIELPSYETVCVTDRTVGGTDGAYKSCYHVNEGEYVPVMKPFGKGERYHITGLVHDDSGFPSNSNETANTLIRCLLNKVDKNRADITQVQEYRLNDANTAVICFGGTTRAVTDAVDAAREKGLNVGMFRPITVWPFPDEQLTVHLSHLENVIVAENNDGQMLKEVQLIIGSAAKIHFVGRIDGGVIAPDEVFKNITEVTGNAE